MASIEVEIHKDRLKIISQAFCCEIHDTWENRKVWFVILRVLCSPETGKPLFSYQAIADAFGYKARQNINNFVHEYEQCNENVFDYLRHKRKDRLENKFPKINFAKELLGSSIVPTSYRKESAWIL